MGTGYTRADVSNNIADGNIINSSDLDNEYDAIEAAFNSSTGHTHDGTSAEGGPITVLGPVQDFVASATEIKPKTTNTLDIGTSGLQFKDLYLDGTAYLDDVQAVGAVDITGDLDVDNININGNTISSTDTNGNITLAPNGTGVVALSSTDLTFGDNDKAIFGAGSDLQIYHDGSHSYIDDTGTGSLILRGNGAISLQKYTGETMGQFTADAAVALYYDNAQKFQTTSGGIDVTGTVTADGLTVDGDGTIGTDTGGILSIKGGSTTSPQVRFFDGGTGRARIGVPTGQTYLSLSGSDTLTADVVINSSGNVGIGTTSPNKSSSSTALTVNTSSAANYSALELSSGDTLNWHINANNSAVYDVTAGTRNRIFYTNGSEAMRITSGGNVGIGTTSVATNFRQEIVGLVGSNTSSATSGTTQNASAVMRIRPGGGFTATLDIGQGGGTGSWLQSTDTTNLATTYPLLLNPVGGDVGIGTASPSVALDVEASGWAGLDLNGTSGGEIRLQKNGTTYGNLYASDTAAFVLDAATGNEIVFKDSGAERMRIDSSGNVGIGTSSPIAQSKLTVAGGAGSISVTGSDGNFSAGGQRSFIDFAVGKARIGGTGGGSTGTTLGLYVGTGTEAISVTAAGDVSIPTTNAQFLVGLSSSTEQVHIKKTTNTGLRLETTNTNGIANIDLQNDARLYRMRINGGNSDALELYDNTAGSTRLVLDSSGNVGIGTTSPGFTFGGGIEIERTGSATMRVENSTASVAGEISAYSAGSGMLVYTTTAHPIAFGTSGGEKMRLDTSGNLLVNYTSSNGAYKLQVNSQIFATSATIATSDGNYKENITPLDGALSLVSQLNPVQFDWKEHPVHEFDRNQPTIGFIAQEVQQVLAEQPYLNSIVKSNECVLEPEETDGEGNVIKEAVTEPFLGIAEGNMVALLTAAIKEQQETITALEARIAALEAN